jgi:hypothetical protein
LKVGQEYFRHVRQKLHRATSARWKLSLIPDS